MEDVGLDLVNRGNELCELLDNHWFALLDAVQCSVAYVLGQHPLLDAFANCVEKLLSHRPDLCFHG